MTTQVLRRILWAGPVLLVATTCAFLALRLIPGDPVSLMLAGRPASEEIRQNLRQKLGLDRPLAAQYLHFLGGALRGDFGESYLTRQPVTRVIGQQLPASLQLAAGGLVIGLSGGIALGLLGGLRPGGLVDGLVMVTALVGVSLPGFWTAMLRFDANGDGRIGRDEITEHFTLPFRPELPIEILAQERELVLGPHGVQGQERGQEDREPGSQAGDRSAAGDDEALPAEEERGRVAVGLAQVHVLAAGPGQHGPELGVREGARE
jgi:hypothetical protein